MIKYVSCMRPWNLSQLQLHMYLVSVLETYHSSSYICILYPSLEPITALVTYVSCIRPWNLSQLWLHMYLVSVLGTYHSSSYICFFFLCPQNLHSQLHMVTHVTYPSLKTVKVFGQNCLNDEISSQNFYHNVPDK